MAIEFAIEDRQAGRDAAIVAVAGEIDLFTAPEFKQRIDAAIDRDARVLVVDLTETTFVDSSSLGVLIGAHRRLADRGGAMAVACANEALVKTFKITGLDGLLRLAPSLEAALADEAIGARR
jgi:anti-sigma B factor antagonist